ncbi:MAG: hypothetical protein IT583_01245 [Verrucomicrobia bacterium]|nr:hypothetical protein [Verrucomicrobiota bacterium]
MKKAYTVGISVVFLLITAFTLDRFVFGSYYFNNLRANHLLRRELWSIGIVRGETPFQLAVPGNPILRARDITDTAARMVADPFAVQESGQWYLFFEIDSVSTHQGEIGLATSTDTTNWVYQQIVLDEPFHLSYPYVFKWDGVYYMIPESHKANAIRLYRADPFPTHWTHVTDLIQGDYQDPSIVRYDNRWWIFASTGQNENMEIFYADKLTGPWCAHPKNPVIPGDRTRARCGGRIREINGNLVRFAQDCLTRYGHRLQGFKITTLTLEDYKEQSLEENPLLVPDGSGWNAYRMHQLDLYQTGTNSWIGFVDGNAH